MGEFFTNREERLKSVAQAYIDRQKPRGINRTCKWYPCHQKVADCTFCICPFYPCQSPELGEWFHYDKAGEVGKVWDCSKCFLNHEKDTVVEMIEEIKDVRDHQTNMTLFPKYRDRYLNRRTKQQG